MEKIGKAFTVVLWLAVAFQWLVGIDGSVGQGLHYAGLFLVVAHIIETGVFWGKISQGGNIPRDAVMTLIFGYFHASFIQPKN